MKCRALLGFGLLLAGGGALAQDYVITTVAGGAPPATPSEAASTSIGDPPRVAVDSHGNVYFGSLHSVFRVDTEGTLRRIAGTGRYGRSGDGGPATQAQLTYPEGLAADDAGNVWVVDRDANVIRRISPAGVISTYAGTGELGYAGDGGPATAARFRRPAGLALDGAGNLYVADTGNNVIRRISPAGAISTVAGNTATGFSGDGGPAADAVLNGPEGVAVDGEGNLYIADTFNHRIRRVTRDGVIDTFAGNGYPAYGGDNGPATQATLFLPTDVTVDHIGRVYIADLGSVRVRKVDRGVISTVAGTSFGIPPVDGFSADSVQLTGPTGVAVDAAGAVYFAEGSLGTGSGLSAGDFKIWKVSTDGVLSTLAGDGLNSFSGDLGPALAAQFDAPAGLAWDASGNLYVADSANHRVRRISADGQIVTVAGNGLPGFAGDGGKATTALLNRPLGVAVDAEGNLFIADTGNNRVREVFPDGIIGTVAGNGNAAYFGDGGRALDAALRAPGAVALDADGTLYIADTENHRVRKVVSGIIDTVVSRGFGFGGDGGQAANALLNLPSALAFDAGGNLYIADRGNDRVRKVSRLGVITTVADELSGPRGLAVDREGSLFISESDGNRVRRVALDGTVSTIAGTGECCYSNDGGPALDATLNQPWGLAADPAGNVYVSDAGNQAIRRLRPSSAGSVGVVANAASNRAGPVSPGEIVTIFSSAIGPAEPLQFSSLNSLGLVGTQLGGVTVRFNGTPGPVLYASSTQVTAVVPYAVTGPGVLVSIEYQSRVTLTAFLPLAATAPALFTADASGKGQALAFNANGARNSASNPAAPSGVITLYATGEGATVPAGVDGKPAAVPAPRPVAPVSVTIGGREALLQSAGGSPGAVAGLMELKVRIPPALPSGPAPVLLRVGDAESQPNVTIVIGEN